MDIRNILELTTKGFSKEVFEELAANEKVHIERIISTGQSTPEGEWLRQEKSEFVLLVSGRAGLQIKGQEEVELKPGDNVVIPPNTEHRVAFTQKEPATIWLAVHY